VKLSSDTGNKLRPGRKALKKGKKNSTGINLVLWKGNFPEQTVKEKRGIARV